jgi:hypothetical protein
MKKLRKKCKEEDERVGPSRRRGSAARLRIGDGRVAAAGEVE